ncbi:MAG: transposase domain-containing protein [Polyangiaceae bacterium]
MRTRRESRSPSRVRQAAKVHYAWHPARLIAGCKLHSLDAERYLAEVIRVMPYWPRERFLELAPAYWAQTRARLDPTELEAELGFVTVPPAAANTPEQSSAA